MGRTCADSWRKVWGWMRWVLLGSETSWGARLATGRTGILVLAGFALLMQVVDLATGVRMMLVYGVEAEQNPLARAIMAGAGPLALVELKLGVVLSGLLTLVRTAARGRGRLARNCLMVAAGLGMLGWTSNLIG